MHKFWEGFTKRAAGGEYGDGGQGFTGAGKKQLAGQLDDPGNKGQGPVGISGGSDHGTSDGETLKTDKTLLDRERNPGDFSIFSAGGPPMEDENGTKVVY